MLKPAEAYDLKKAYYQARKQAEAMSDTNEKIAAYNNIINYCILQAENHHGKSATPYQILFCIYNHIGDIFMAKNVKHPHQQNYLRALQYYCDSLAYALNRSEQHHALEKIARIYAEIQDEENFCKTKEQIALLEEKCMKRQAFTELAKQTYNLKLQTEYLEYALTFVMSENISALEKSKNILDICSHLLRIYKRTKNNKCYRRIKELEQTTRELLQ